MGGVGEQFPRNLTELICALSFWLTPKARYFVVKCLLKKETKCCHQRFLHGNEVVGHSALPQPSLVHKPLQTSENSTAD